MPAQPKASTIEHELWRMEEWVGENQARTYYSWCGRCKAPFVSEGEEDWGGFWQWVQHSLIPYYLLLSGALPSELP